MKKGFLAMLFLMFLMIPIQSSASCSHNWTEWKISYNATCSDDGEMYRYCTICDEEEYEVIPATGEHSWSDWIVDEEASCYTVGYEYRYCRNCDEEESREIPAIGSHDWGEWVTIDEPDCLNEGLAERECKRCDACEEKKLDSNPSAHSYGKWYVTKKATLLSKGKKERECYICGYTQTKNIAKLTEATASTSKEKKVVKVVNNLFSNAQTYDTAKLKACFKNPDKAMFFTSEKMISLATKYNTKYLKYAIQSISVSGSNATVKVYCQYMDYGDAYWQAIINVAGRSDAATVSEETTTKRLETQIAKCIKSVGGTKTLKTITINLKKSSGEWKITTTSTTLLDALNMGYMTVYKALA